MIQPRGLIPLSESGAPRPAPRGMPEPHAHMPKAKELKDKIANRIDEAISYAYPGRDGINQDADQSQVYDDTAMLAAPEFASRIQQGILPNFSRWGTFLAGLLVPQEQREELAAALESVDAYLYEMIGGSNITTEATESIMDVALGTGALRIDEFAGGNPFNARAIPLRGLSFCIGPDGRPDPIYETRKVAIAHLEVLWPGATIPAEIRALDQSGDLEVVEAWHRDWRSLTLVKYRQTVFVPSMNNVVLLQKNHEGDGCCPVIVFRWSKTSGEGWGRGPLFNCLPSMRKANFAEQALLDHTEMALAGIWTVEDDGVINTDTVRLEAGTLVPRASGSQPLQNVAPDGDFRIAEFSLEGARLSIRKALYTEQLGNPNKTPMSATEVTQRMTELARAIGSPFGRLIAELVFPLIVRCVYILKDRKLIKLPVIDGKEIKLVSTSSLAQVQKFEDIEKLERFLASLGGLFGQQAINVAVKMEEVSHDLAANYGVPLRLLRSREEQAQIVQQVAASVGQTGGGAGTPGAGAPGPQGGTGPGA